MNNLFRHLIPRYDELSLFAMSLTCILIFLANIDFIRGAHFSLSSGDESPFLLLVFLAIFFAGWLLSFFHAFTKRRKTVLEKFLMVFFAVIVNAVSGITAGMYVWEKSYGYLALFPILNILNGFMLLVLLRENVINENSVSDENVDIRAVAVGSGAVILVFLICQYAIKLFWASTFSLCVVYATNLNRVIVNVFFKKKLVRIGSAEVR
jgi:hypothetical protein